jgi:spore coat protein CotH
MKKYFTSQCRHLLFLCFIPLSMSTLSGQTTTLYDSSVIQEIKIYFNQANWSTLLNTAAASPLEPYTLARRVVVNGVSFDSVGAKYKGNSSFRATNKKNPWHIELDYVKNQDYQGIKDIKLANVFADPSFVREALSYELMQPYTDLPRANFARVYVNDTLIGLYTNTEAVTKTFAKKHFPASDDNVFVKCTPPSLGAAAGGSSLVYSNADTSAASAYYKAYEIYSDYGWKQLVNLCDTLNNKPAEIEKILDVDRSLWMLGYNILFVNLDSYTGAFTQNYYLWRDNNLRFNPIIWDLNMSFGAFSNLGVGGATDSLSLAKLNPYTHETNPSKPLISKLLSNARYKKMYIAHIRTMTKEVLKSGKYKTRGEQMQTLIDAAVQQDVNKFYAYSLFKSNLYYGTTQGGTGGSPGIVSLMENKIKYLDTLAATKATPPTISNIVNTANPRLNDSVWITATITDHTAGGVLIGYRLSPFDYFRRFPMFDDGLHRDGAANDGVFGAGVKATAASIEYYIWAENDLAGIFSPERAEHDFHRINIQLSSVLNAGDVVINELMADNTKSAVTPNGNFEDWVELYNRTSAAISLAGAYLSDDKTVPTKWKFSSTTTIPANGYLIVWLDGDSTNVSETRPHTNFKLSANGEAVILSNTAKTIVDSVTFLKQGKDTSWARYPNGTGAFRRLMPTFNFANVLTSTHDLADGKLLSIYPNPTNGGLTIESKSTPLSNLTVFNTVGQAMKVVKGIDNQQYTLDLGGLPEGIYFLKIDNYSLRKVLLQR